MNFTIRKGTEEDFPSVLALIKELAAFERAPDKVTNTVEQMHREKELFRCFVVENDKREIIGMALYFFAYYTWVGKSLYLEDLYIRDAYRRQNIGSELLKKIFEVAREEGCKRVRWQVLNWNTNAIEMYKRNGAEVDDEWLNCNYDEDAINRFGL